MRPLVVLEDRVRGERRLEVGLRALDRTGLLVEQAARRQGRAVVLVDRNRPVVAVDRLVVLALGVIGIAAIAIGHLEPARLERNRAVEVLDRAVVFLDLVVMLAAVDVGVADLLAGGV